MSYDPLKVSVGDLHTVIEVFRAVRPGEDEGEPHDARPSRREKDIGGKILRAAPPARRGPDGSPRARLQISFLFLFLSLTLKGRKGQEFLFL